MGWIEDFVKRNTPIERESEEEYFARLEEEACRNDEYEHRQED